MQFYTLTMRIQADDDVGPQEVCEAIYDKCRDVPFGFDITAITNDLAADTA